MTLTAVLTPDADGGFVAFNPETGTTTQGESIAEALVNLKEATELYLEEFPLNRRPAVLDHNRGRWCLNCRASVAPSASKFFSAWDFLSSGNEVAMWSCDATIVAA